jgi:hypothetical protein
MFFLNPVGNVPTWAFLGLFYEECNEIEIQLQRKDVGCNGVRAPAQPRVGTTHTYEPNGTLMLDVLEDGKWITKRAVPAGDVHKRAA